jgi:hypothetical protein
MVSRLSYRRYDSWDGLASPLSLAFAFEPSDKDSVSGFDLGGRDCLVV